MMSSVQQAIGPEIVALLSRAPEGPAIAESLTREGFRITERADAGGRRAGPSDRGLLVVLADLDHVDHSDSETLAVLAGEQRCDDVVLILLCTEGSGSSLCRSIRDRADIQLCKPVSTQNLVAIVKAAMDSDVQREKLRCDVQCRSSAIGAIVAGSFEIRSLEEARNLARMLSIACPDPDRVAVGFVELMVNAVEHGNLEIGYELKTKLLESGCWAEEITTRLANPRYASRVVRVDFRRSADLIELQVADEGSGFDPTPFQRAGPRCFQGSHGRGLLIATNGCFDGIEFLGQGNVVKVWVKCARD